jgi:Tfp pilus assembly protein PilF
MSLVSDLLAKVKHREAKSDVPPTLRDDILRSLQQRRARRRWLLSAAAALVVVGAGLGLVWWLESEPPASLLTRSAAPTAGPAERPGAVPSPEIPAAPPEQPAQPSPSPTPPSSAEAPAAPPAASVPGAPPVPPSTASEPAPTTAPPPAATPPAAAPPAQPAEPATQGAAGQSVQINALRREAKPPNLAAESPSTRPRNGLDASPEEQRIEAGIAARATEGSSVKGKVSSSEVATDAAGGKARGAQATTATESDGREGQVKPELQGAPPRTPKWDRDVYLYQASTSEAAGDFKQALASYRKVLAVEPKNYVVLNNVAGLLVRLGSYDEAIGSAEKSLAVKPNHVPSLINMSIAYIQKGSAVAGENCLRRALAAEPSNRMALKTLAVQLEQKGALEEAGAVFAKLAQTGDAQGFLGMARVAEKQGQTEAAIKAYQAVLLLDRVDPRERALAGERVYQLTR